MDKENFTKLLGLLTVVAITNYHSATIAFDLGGKLGKAEAITSQAEDIKTLKAAGFIGDDYVDGYKPAYFAEQ